MKRCNTSKKHIIVLPKNYQELVILKEMEFSGGDQSIELIRELLYLYSIGMEYYDSLNNNLLYSHYYQRNSSMLNNPEVISVLDQTETKSVSSFKIDVLEDHPYQIISNSSGSVNIQHRKRVCKQNTMFSDQKDLINQMLTKDSNETNNNSKNIMSSPFSPKKHNHQDLKKGVKNEFDKLETKLNKMENILGDDINTQKSSFEERKKKKQDIMNVQRKSRRFMVRKGSKLDDLLVAIVARNSLSNELHQTEIIKGIMELSENKVKSAEASMMKDIQEFIEKDIAEMNKALQELRISFEDEIKNLDEEVFPDVVRGLKEDMEAELEILKDQYEEQRSEGIEKIKTKYNLKK